MSLESIYLLCDVEHDLIETLDIPLHMKHVRLIPLLRVIYLEVVFLQFTYGFGHSGLFIIISYQKSTVVLSC